VRRRAKASGRRAAVLAAAAAVTFGAGRARAEIVYDLAPAAGVGITNNANLAAPPSATMPNAVGPQRDEFTNLEIAARARYLGASSNYMVGYRLAWTHYFQGHGIATFSNDLMLLANLNPTSRLELHLTGNASLSRVSSVVLTNPATGVPPTGTVGGDHLYLGVGAGEEAVYHPNARWTYLETVTATRITYLDSGAPPDGLTVTGRGRAEVTTGLDTYSLEASGFGTISAIDALSAQLLAGWRREISVNWTSELQLGVMGLFSNTTSTVGPSGNAILSYRHIPWFATLTVSRIPTANLFLGEPTVNNQAVLRLTLPLNREETAAITGMAAYLYANQASAQFTRAYDQRSAAATIGSRLGKLPLYASLDYTILSQHNNPDVPTPAPNLFRWVLTLNLRALFTFGPGTPPILGAPI
jgi:hypothetical protein